MNYYTRYQCYITMNKINKKKCYLFLQEENEPHSVPVRAAPLRSYLSRRVGSGYTLQSDPTRRGDYYIELRVYNTKEIEALGTDRWKRALVTLRSSTNGDTRIWKAVTQLVVAAKEEYRCIQPVLYPSNFN